MLNLGKKSEYTIHFTCIDVKLKWICIEKQKFDSWFQTMKKYSC